MVLEILADAAELVHDRDAELVQQRRRADAGQLQQLRALQRAGAKQDALIFYRAYLHKAEPGSPQAARAVAQMSAIEGAPKP